jgi:site-specific recombinase XerD
MIHSFPLAPYVRSFFEDHLACRRNVSRNTIHSYRDALKLFLNFVAQHMKKSVARLLVDDLTETVVVAFLADLEQSRGNSIQTRNHRLVALRNLFDYIASREPLLMDQCRRLLQIPRKRGAAVAEIRYLEREQLTAIFDTVARDTPQGRRDYTLLLFMYNTGARVQEAADVQISRITVQPPAKVELLGKGCKWRACPLWDSTAHQLQQLIEERRLEPAQDGCLFVNRHGDPLSRSGIADILRRYVTRAAATTPSLKGVRVTPHTLRHTTAMHLLQSGVEVNVIRSWLGHVSIATTNRYIEIDMAMKRKALEVCELDSHERATPRWRTDPNILAWLESL